MPTINADLDLPILAIQRSKTATFLDLTTRQICYCEVEDIDPTTAPHDNHNQTNSPLSYNRLLYLNNCTLCEKRTTCTHTRSLSQETKHFKHPKPAAPFVKTQNLADTTHIFTAIALSGSKAAAETSLQAVTKTIIPNLEFKHS